MYLDLGLWEQNIGTLILACDSCLSTALYSIITAEVEMPWFSRVRYTEIPT